MNRRTALKIATVTALSATMASAYDQSLIVNNIDMKIKNPSNPTKGELKHSPEIKLGSKDTQGFTLVEINVGQEGIIHPSTEKHWIYEIELFANGKKVSSVKLEPKTSRGYLSTKVNLSNVKTLSAVSKCNLHGNYTSSIEV